MVNQYITDILSKPGIYTVVVSEKGMYTIDVKGPSPDDTDAATTFYGRLLLGILTIVAVAAIPVWLPLFCIGWAVDKVYKVKT